MMLFVGEMAVAKIRLKARWDFSLTGSFVNMNQEAYSDFNQFSEYLAVGGVQQIVEWRPWIFEIRPEMRYLNSPAYNTDQQDIAYPYLDFPDRFFELGNRLQRTKTDELYFDIETLYLKLQKKQFEMLVGRQVLSIGAIKNFPIWNKFAAFNLVNTRMQFQPGVDQLNARLQGNNWWIQGLSVLGSRAENNAYLGIVGFPLDIFEIQFLIANWWNESVAGFNWQKDLDGLLLKTEWLFVGLNEDSEEKNTQGAVSAEYAFNEFWSTTVEVIYFDKGKFVELNTLPDRPSKFFPLFGRNYLVWQLDWQVTPFWTASAVPIVNLGDGSSLFTFILRQNLSDNTDLTFQAKFPTRSDKAEFSSKAFQFSDGSYLGINETFTLQLKTFF